MDKDKILEKIESIEKDLGELKELLVQAQQSEEDDDNKFVSDVFEFLEDNNIDWFYSNPEDFDIEDGILYKYNGFDTHIIIPKGVKAIYSDAFKHHSYIRYIKLPKSIDAKRLTYAPFSCIKDMPYLVVPGSVDVNKLDPDIRRHMWLASYGEKEE